MRPQQPFAILTSLLFLACIYMSCSRNYTSPVPTPPVPATSIQGKWNIVTVTTIAYDANGQLLSNARNIYTPPAGTYFEFDGNGRWTESLSADSLPFVTMRGTYTVASNTSFTFSDSLGNHTDCIVDSLSSSLFVFDHQRSTLFDGVTPGSLKYVFRMTK